MAVLNIVPGNFAFIYNPLLRKKINRVSFLKQGIALVFFITEHFPDAAFIPLCFSVPVLNSLILQFPGYPVRPFAFKIISVNPSYDFCLFFIDNKLPVFTLVVA
jgi:hypothetical protein